MFSFYFAHYFNWLLMIFAVLKIYDFNLRQLTSSGGLLIMSSSSHKRFNCNDNKTLNV